MNSPNLKDIIKDEIITFQNNDEWIEQVIDDKLLDNICERIQIFLNNQLTP